MTKKVNITCPNCKKIVEIDSRFKPFCSKACKSIDFLRWAHLKKSILLQAFEQKGLNLESISTIFLQFGQVMLTFFVIGYPSV